MNFNANDNPVLVAPRPVRLTGGQHTLFTRSYPSRLISTPADIERMRINDGAGIDDLKLALYTDSTSDKDMASPRSSPRSGLPTEALEEFLSILRPSFFPPTSPVLRTRRQGAVSLPTFQHERSFSYKSRGRLEMLHQKNEGLEDTDIERSTRNTRPSTPDSLNEIENAPELDTDMPPLRWFKSTILASPISRTHTRNPFLRHVSNQSPGPISPLSPTAIPLPLPTPDEMIEIF